MGNITIQGDLTGDVPGGEVGGASNLTTVGAIPYVSAAGTLNQDPTALFWDAANNRLGVGTNAPSATLEVSGSAPGFTVTRTSISAFTLDNSGSSWRLASTGNQALAFFANSAERGRFASTTGNLLIGTTTDSNYKLDVAASGSAGTARFYGGSGVSDTTKVVVRAGAANVTGDKVIDIQDASGTSKSFFRSDGLIAGILSTVDIATAALSTQTAGYTSGLNLASTGLAAWSSTSNWFDTKDVSISRASAGVLQVGNGGANANGYLSAARIGVGTASPTKRVSVSTTGTDGFNILWTTGAQEVFALTANTSTGEIRHFADTNYFPAFWANNLERARIATSGNFLIGTTTDLGYGLHAANKGTNGNLLVFDPTAATGSTKLVVRAGAGQSGNLQEWQNSAGTVVASVAHDGIDSQGTFLGNGAYLALKSALASPYASLVFFKNSSTQTWRVGNSGSDTFQFLVGAAENSVASLTSAGTFTVYNQTPTTGVTKAVIRAGAGQGATNLTEWQNAAGTALAYVSSIGTFYSAQRFHTTGDVLLNNAGGVVMDTGGDGVLRLRDNSGTNFSRIQLGGTTSSFPSLKRSSAILQARLADDSANTQMQASRFISDQTTPAASTDAGTAGAIWADANYIYVQTAAGTIKRVALTTF